MSTISTVLGNIRRNHALEHATIAVMMERQGPMRVIGRAWTDGFHIYGNVTTERLQQYADEALRRLQRGEAQLAVSPLCGTNLVVAGVLAGAGSWLAASSGRRRLNGLSNAMAAAVVGVIAAQPIGRLVQKHYTTSPDLDGARILSVERFGRSNVHKVRTALRTA